MNKDLKIKYENDFNKIRLHVNEFDPIGLIKGGAPIDEYDCLTNKILSNLYNKKSREEIKQIIIHEVEDHFGADDLTELKEPYKTKFNNALELLLDNSERCIKV